jgi:hypothetical protein
MGFSGVRFRSLRITPAATQPHPTDPKNLAQAVSDECRWGLDERRSGAGVAEASEWKPREGLLARFTKGVP